MKCQPRINLFLPLTTRQVGRGIYPNGTSHSFKLFFQLIQAQLIHRGVGDTPSGRENYLCSGAFNNVSQTKHFASVYEGETPDASLCEGGIQNAVYINEDYLIHTSSPFDLELEVKY
jgi:hypothetical protein